MSHNHFGHLFKITSFGESHGIAIGCVIDGTPPNIALSAQEIQFWLDKRKPGSTAFVSQRKEQDKVEILSGLFEGKTTGAPIALLIRNLDQRSKDYDELKKTFRPAHADFTYQEKYGVRDWRGGGRSSARETAMRVAAGAVARKIIPHIQIRSALVQMGAQKINRDLWDWDEIDKNPFHCPDAKMAQSWHSALLKARKNGSSLGAVIEVVASNMPIGLGAPIYGKLDSDLAQAMMSINAVKGVEIGDGFAAASLRGEENSDEIRMDKGKAVFLSNHAGGVLGGISTGQDLVVRFAVKPTASIAQKQKSITEDGKEVEIATKGRHDPCVGIRAAPIGEAMMACVLADHYLRHRAQCGES